MTLTISEPIVLTVLGEDATVRPTFRYIATDPYAVTVDFGVMDGEHIIWQFARDLLHDGVVERKWAGVGDVQIYERDVDTIVIALRSPDGAQQLTAAHVDLARFLRHSYAVVARGKESKHLGLDTALTQLLSGGSR